MDVTGKDFAVGVYRHFALLFATGACAPPPSSAQVNGREQKARVSSLKELDQHLFLDALVDVSTLSPGRHTTTTQSQNTH